MNILWALLLFLLCPSTGFTFDPGNTAPDINKVQSAFEKTLSSDPQNKDALFMLGLIYEKKRQTQDALKVWRQYLSAETDPDKRAIAEKHIHRLIQ